MPRRISPQARRRRSFTVLAAILVILVGAWSWFAVTKIYFPRLDPAPENADVLVQVGGIPWKDYQTARDTAQRLGIPDLVLSDPSSGTEVTDRYCGPLQGVRVHCFVPDPSTTRGEARGFAELAEQNDWHSAYVLATGREHVERARLYFSRCWDGELAVNRPASGRSVTVHLKQSAYQTAGWIKALRDRAC
ncbi:hypothetical protein ACTXKQ_03520 [Corynebacterium variabile]|uniref:hypothetical protein n=1 Tax=Corynebacterium variabile TaxID=1727 RepID=UPI002649EEB7|nr:hypothetical protein [Corynebacterium variabile]MDN6662208.1 hypothetical protein [Corynebacterium variabile]